MRISLSSFKASYVEAIASNQDKLGLIW